MKAAAAHTCQCVEQVRTSYALRADDRVSRRQQAVVAALIFAPVFLALVRSACIACAQIANSSISQITSLATFLLCRLLRQQIRSRSVRRSISVGSPFLLGTALPVGASAEAGLVSPTETITMNPLEVQVHLPSSFLEHGGPWAPSEKTDKPHPPSRPSTGRRSSSLSFSSLPTVPSLARLGSKARGLSANTVSTLGLKAPRAEDVEGDVGFELAVAAIHAAGRGDETLDELKRAKRDLQIVRSVRASSSYIRLTALRPVFRSARQSSYS